MGLDTTHNCWHGGYGAFNVWRRAIAEVAGIPLDLMEGFYEPPNETAMEWAAPRDGGPMCGSYYGTTLHAWIGKSTRYLPISWGVMRPDPLIVLLDHSDCDGDIAAFDCAPLAKRLEELLPQIPDGGVWNWPRLTQQFIDGLWAAAAAGEVVEFH
jgi:hypothetical protein